MVSENCFFSCSKLAGGAQNWQSSWRGQKQPCDVNGCTTLKPCQKFSDYGRKDWSSMPPKKHLLGHLRAVKQLIAVALHTEEKESQFYGKP